jgi:crotonobetaine/carnitine-CoA ligase
MVSATDSAQPASPLTVGKRAPLEVLRLYPAHDGTLTGAFESRMRVDAERSFLLFRGREWRRHEFHAAALALARSLWRRGIRPGDRIGVLSRNHEGHVLLLFALARIGAIMVPTNPEFGVAEVKYVFGTARVSAIACSADCLEVARAAVSDSAPAPWFVLFDGEAEGADTLAAMMQLAPAVDLPPNPSADTSCLIIFTSGSTGFPKGALHSQRNFVTAGEANIARLWLQPEDRLLTMLPLFHVNALFYSLAGALAAGACCALEERFSASTFWDTVVATGATTVNIIEAIGRILVARPRSEYRPEHRLRCVYGARPDVREVFRTEFGIPVLLTGFGMTEIPGVFCSAFGAPETLSTMGPIGKHPDPERPWAQCRVVDDDGHDVANETAGELWVKHPIVMQGYFRDEALTRESFHDGWFKTGDLVRRDTQGCFWFVTRKKDIIRRRGENIAGAELDRIICEHPGVSEAAAIPVPSELGEDEILVCVVAHPGALVTPAEIADWCRARLAPMKVPRFVLFTDALPHTPTHKINKQVLREDRTLKQRAVDLQATR